MSTLPKGFVKEQKFASDWHKLKGFEALKVAEMVLLPATCSCEDRTNIPEKKARWVPKRFPVSCADFLLTLWSFIDFVIGTG